MSLTVCATRDIPNSPPALFCTTCEEYFCQRCFSEFHVTTRLKAHTTQRLLNSFASLDPRKTARVDQQHLKKDAGLPPVHGIFQKSSSDVAQLNHTLINGQDSYNRQDERLSNIGSPARELGTQEHTWIGRTTSKLRSVKSGFGVLNALQSTDDLLPQDNSQPGASTVGVVTSDADISGFSRRPSELSEELVRTVALLHQRAAESHSVGALARTGSGFTSSKRKLGRRSSQVSSACRPLTIILSIVLSTNG
jgi:hypothetical protein